MSYCFQSVHKLAYFTIKTGELFLSISLLFQVRVPINKSFHILKIRLILYWTYNSPMKYKESQESVTGNDHQ